MSTAIIELDDTQGLLIQPRTHGFARYLFLRVDSAAVARAWLDALAPDITTAELWPVPPATTTNVALTHHGLAASAWPRTHWRLFQRSSAPQQCYRGGAKRVSSNL
jgi:hypothetical protein